jgi:predicted kinase
VLFAGLPGTGKSTLARALAERLEGGVAILDKDLVRNALFPDALTDYTAEQDELCMRAIVEAAGYLTGRRRVKYIFFDGRTFSTRKHREHVLLGARQAGVRSCIVHVVCEDAVAEERLARKDPSHPAKNRDVALYRRVKQNFEPILEPRLEVDTTLGIEPELPAVEAYLTDGE